MRLIGRAHVLLHNQGVIRIQTDIRVGSRYASANLDIESLENQN